MRQAEPIMHLTYVSLHQTMPPGSYYFPDSVLMGFGLSGTVSDTNSIEHQEYLEIDGFDLQGQEVLPVEIKSKYSRSTRSTRSNGGDLDSPHPGAGLISVGTGF